MKILIDKIEDKMIFEKIIAGKQSVVVNCLIPGYTCKVEVPLDIGDKNWVGFQIPDDVSYDLWRERLREMFAKSAKDKQQACFFTKPWIL